MSKHLEVNIQSIINLVYINQIYKNPVFYIGSHISNTFNLFQKDWDAVLLERLLDRRFHIVEYPYISIFAVQNWC